MPRSMDEYLKSVGVATSLPRDAIPPTKPIAVADFEEKLGGQTARPDMGIVRNWQADSHTRKLQLKAYKDMTVKRYELLGELAMDALKAEAELIREQYRSEWSHQYAVLAEKAAVGEMSVMRRLDNVLSAGRELLFNDRKDAMDRIEELHAAGLLSSLDFTKEINYLYERYEKLLEAFVGIVDERCGAVRGAFRSSATTPKGAL